MGQALWNLRRKYPRDSYTLITKCGRVDFHHFDYSASWIRKSVLRSLERLRTEYLDLVLLHDAEFTTEVEVLEGISELRKLRSEGIVGSFGLSGYTLPTLLSYVEAVKAKRSITVEAIFNYCNFNLQNTTLAEYSPKFRQAGVKHIINGSPLSMGLLRSEAAPDWHPAAAGLKAACQVASRRAEEKYGEKLADIALRYAFQFDGTTCAGCSSLVELEAAISAWKNIEAQRQHGQKNEKDEMIFQELQEILMKGHEISWPVPPIDYVRK